MTRANSDHRRNRNKILCLFRFRSVDTGATGGYKRIVGDSSRPTSRDFAPLWRAKKSRTLKYFEPPSKLVGTTASSAVRLRDPIDIVDDGALVVVAGEPHDALGGKGRFHGDQCLLGRLLLRIDLQLTPAPS